MGFVARHIVALAAMVFLISGCGKKAPLRQPPPETPPAPEQVLPEDAPL